MTPRRPILFSLYRVLCSLLSPVLLFWLNRRAKAGKEDPARLDERLGTASLHRPAGPLVWLHGASVGESKLALILVEALAKARPDLAFLITTGTRTSAQLLQTTMPAKTCHQYCPIDTPRAAHRFIAHWQPDLGIFIESELWPNLLFEARAAHIPLALVNARMNQKSLARWQRHDGFARFVFGHFSFIGAGDTQTRSGLGDLARMPPVFCDNLKRAAPAPQADKETLGTLIKAVGARPVWLAASTHAGEEEIVLAAHTSVHKKHPGALLIIVPRHPERGADIARLCQRRGIKTARRTQTININKNTGVYIADTLGEMGIWMRLCQTVFMGGSLLPSLSGHNPLEAAHLKSAIICGPYRASFADFYAGLGAKNACIDVKNAATLAQTIEMLWDNPEKIKEMEKAAQTLAAQGGAQALRKTMTGLKPLLPGAE